MKGSFSSLLVGVIIIVIFLVIGFYNVRSLNDLDRDVQKIKADIEEQRIMAPLYNDLIEKIKVKTKKHLPFPAKAKLPREQHEQITSIFGELAKRANLEVVSITPDVNSLAGGSGLLVVNAALKGDFFNFRNYLIELGNVPYLEHLGEIQIQTIPGGREFHLKLWVSVG
ncbi:MAG TPA: hypothetical protein PLR20_04355 [Syntrophales bacterium]|nr:hypothetical protein [Syntrophales bacterium]HOX94833.1 hypothetical protein [Syntrophales bacterium]HPI56400.1 hypothetical protein [Syntrophales bacterium]HPN24213.1 hypothetical protein [Syntrophales bacterium]HQM28566.1 hypothetical protein [Syntrophales bacterium]